MKIVSAADLFCGAGGTSTGLLRACQQLGLGVDLLAVNHWPTAIDTHSLNHPGVRHMCADIEAVNPRKVVPGGHLNLLLASPECIHHSNARGGKPMSDQSRASAWHVLRWAEAVRIENILIENVREFREWGPLGADGRPLKSKRGSLYREFLRTLRVLGYTVEDRILNAADYGDATTRQRLFIQARLGRKKIAWPDPTHQPPGADSLGLFPEAQPWRAAREIIDWSLPSQSIFERKKPLAPNTMARIMAGLQKFCGLPFILPHRHGGDSESARQVRSIDAPLPTVTAQSSDMFLAQPFLVVLQNGRDAVSLDQPLPTVLTSGAHFGLCQPFVIGQQSGGAPRSVDAPVPTVAAKGAIGLVEPFLVQLAHNGNGHNGHAHRCYPVGRPVPTVAGKGMFGLVQSFIIPTNHGKDLRSHSVESPMPTVTTVDAWGLIQPRPYLVEYHGGKDHASRTRSVDEPLPTQTCENRFGLAEPFLVKYHGTGGAYSVDDPLATVTARDRFGLVTPELLEQGAVMMLDVHFRMLQPRELARAQGFPDTYEFAGNREQKVRQIGNAVPCNLARALCLAILGGAS